MPGAPHGAGVSHRSLRIFSAIPAVRVLLLGLDLRYKTELAVQLGGGILSHPHIKRLRLYHPLTTRRAPELKLFGAQLEMERLFGACPEVDALKALELPDRPRRAARSLVNVELRHSVSSAASRVSHVDGYVESSANFRLRLA